MLISHCIGIPLRAVIRQSGHPRNIIKTLDAVGRLVQRQGDYGWAHTLHKESLTLCLNSGQQALCPHSLEAFACLAAEQEQAERAASLFGAAEAYFVAAEVRTDLIRVLRQPHLRAEHDRLVAAARTQLGEAAFAAAWAAGAAMGMEQAIAHALEPDPLSLPQG